MKLSDKSAPTKSTFNHKLTQFIFVALLMIMNLVLLWATLTYLSNGLNLASTALFLTVFLIFTCVGILLYHQNYLKLTQWLKRRFPQLTSAKILQITFIIAITLGVLFRLAFLLISDRYQPESELSDTGFHWFFSQKLAHGTEPGIYDGGYGAFFPHLMTYSATLAGFMKIFGTGYPAILLSNLFFDLITTVLLYYLLKKWQSQKTAQIGAIIWLLNPLEIIFCAVGVSIVVTNTVLALALLLAFLVIKHLSSRAWVKLALLSLALGITFGIGNAYRPIFTVLLIAIIMLYILQIIRQPKVVIIQASLSIILIIAGLFGAGKLIDLSYQTINPYHVPGGTGVGWNFFVGANYDSWGRWNREDSSIFGKMLFQEDGDEVWVNSDLVGMQKELFSQGLQRYQAMSPAQLVAHFVHKTTVFFADNGDTITWVFNESFPFSTNRPFYRFIDGCGVITLFAGLILSLLYFSQLLNQKAKIWQPYLIFLMLSFCGIIAASLLVEVMHRYILPLTIFMTLFAACYLANIRFSKGKTSVNQTSVNV